MSESEKQEHWKKLLDELGIEEKPEGDEPPDEPAVVAQLPPAEPSKPTTSRVTAPPPRKKNHWQWIAGVLGVAPTEEPTEEPAPAADAVANESEIETAGHMPVDEQPPSVVDQSDEVAVEAAAESGFEATDVDDPLVMTRESFVDEVTSIDDTLDAEEPEQPRAEAVEETKDDSSRGRRRRRRPRRRRSATPSAEDVVEPVAQDDTTPEASTVESESASTADRDQTREPVEVAAEASSAESSEHERAKPESPKHRKIPSWEDAVGVIVEGNLESRKRGSGGGRQRGRR